MTGPRTAFDDDPRPYSGNVEHFPADRARPPAAVPLKHRLRYPSEIEGVPPAPLWLVDAMLLPGTVCLLSGAPSIGKSLAAMQMLTAISLGEHWMGRATVQARCLAMFCEDRQEQLDRRALAICEHYGVHQSVLEHEFAWDAREDVDSVLWDVDFGRGKPTEFWHQLFDDDGLIAEHQYRVLLLDTAAAIFQGNHNDTRQVNLFGRALTREAVRHNLAILLNTHPSRSAPRSSGGSTQWEAAFRFAFNISRPKPPPGVDEEEMTFGDFGLQRVFRGLGSNYVATPKPETWRWQNGVFVLDDVEQAGRRKSGPLSQVERQELRYRLLMGLKRAMMHGVLCPADVMADKSLPQLARIYGPPEIRLVALNEMYAAQEELLKDGQLVMVQVRNRVLIRPVDGPRYDGEAAWKPLSAPIAQAAD